MIAQSNIKRNLCALFEVTETSNGGWCVVTPMQYNGSNDQIVVYIRPADDGWIIDDNGDSVLNANLLGFDASTEAIERWSSEMALYGPTAYDLQSESVYAKTSNENLLATYVFRVAESAQQLFTIATQRQERRAHGDFRDRVGEVVRSVAANENKTVLSDVDLPIAGGLTADFVIEQAEPLIVIAATSVARLMEAEIIFMQYRHQKMPGFVLAIAENPQAVGRKQFDRANYYTGKTVSFSPSDLAELVKSRLH